MIVKEFLLKRKDGVKLYKSYSNEGFYIKQVETGVIYTSAIDVENAPYNYVETADKIPDEEKRD